MNFAECPDDGSRLKVDPSYRRGSGRVIMKCPTCGKRYTLGDAGVVEIPAD